MWRTRFCSPPELVESELIKFPPADWRPVGGQTFLKDPNPSLPVKTVFRHQTFRCLAVGMLLCHALARDVQAGSVSFLPDGKAVLENARVRITVSNGVGADHGLVGWQLKPDGAELIQVLYGQTDYLKGHALGELFDPVPMGSRLGGRPKVGKLYVPERVGTLEDGSAVLRQSAEGDYRLTRTLTLAEGAAFVVADYRLENVRGKPEGFAMRFHTVWSPGNDGRSQSLEESVVLPADPAPFEIDQNMGASLMRERFGSDRFFSREAVSLPKPDWAHNASKVVLTANWAAQVGRLVPRGFFCTVEPASFAGYYNSLAATLEPLLKPVVLSVGESLVTRVTLGSFTPPKGALPAGGSGFYVETRPLRWAAGRVQGSLVPLFEGTLEFYEEFGLHRASLPVSADVPLEVDVPCGSARWSFRAKSLKGALLGSAGSNGLLEFPGKLPAEAAPRSAPKDAVVVADAGAVREFLVPRDFRIFCEHDAPESQRQAAERIARRLGVGIEWSEPKGKILVIGDPSSSAFVRDGGRLRGALDAAWPGAGRGVVSAHANLELTTAPVLFVGGSDARGALGALEYFEREFVAALPARTGFSLWTAPVSERIYANAPARTGARGPIEVRAARGEYESAQAVLTAFEDLSQVEVSAAPLVHTVSGREIDNKQFTRARQVHGPLRIRWVESFPLKAENRWSGHPDALLDRPETEVPAGKSQTLWLTFIVSENAEPGLYRSTLRCSVGGKEQTLPIELTVRPFTIPRTGIPGDPYMSLKHLPPDDQRDLKDPQITAFVQNMVEHGMRYLHLGHKDLVRWHLDPTGGMKNASIPGVEVSEDGVLAMDASRLDELVRKMDAAAKPYELKYMIYSNAVVDDAWSIQKFRKELPERHAGKPKREGNDVLQNYYVEEMYTVYRRHLEKMGWLDRLSFKVSDEPPSFDYWWHNLTLAARNAGLPIITAFNSIDPKEALKGVDTVAQWQVIYMKHDPNLQKAVQAAGGRYGWYNCGPPPRIAAGAPAAEIRGYLWQAAKADLDFICWWGIQNWESHHNVWFNRYSHWNSVTYPPHPFKPVWQDKKRGALDGVILDSVRWELIREGLEDTAYVRLLREEILKAETAGRTAAAAQSRQALERIWSETFPDLNAYGPEYSRLESVRETVAGEIVKLQAAAGK